MKKTILVSAIAVSALGSINAHADIAITNLFFGTTNYASSGSLRDDGNGMMQSVAPFFYHTWTATQATMFMDTSGSFAGDNAQGAWDYSADIAGMTSAQVAVGFFYNWNGNSNVALLEIFNCANDVCTGMGASSQNGPVLGAFYTFSGTGEGLNGYVPVPAAVWLFGSGLIGLVGFARRRKA